MLQPRNDIRNIAIIAHVDHGKTTLVVGLPQHTIDQRCFAMIHVGDDGDVPNVVSGL